MKYFTNNNSKGFTLIEMLIVVALVAILAAIAMPAYNGYVNRSKIKTAQADLTALGLNFENYYQRKLSYPHAGNEADAPFDTTVKLTTFFSGWSPASNTTEFAFSHLDATDSATTYSITATGQNNTGVAGCTISLTNAGTKTLTGTSCSYKKADNSWL